MGVNTRLNFGNDFGKGFELGVEAAANSKIGKVAHDLAQQALEAAYLQSYAEFYDYIRTKKFYISRPMKSEIGTNQWKDLLKTYIGLFTTDRTKAPAPDEVYAEIAELFPHLLPQDTMNEHDQLIDILNALERGKQAKATLRQQYPPKPKAKFDSCAFHGARNDEFVLHARKYTEEQALEKFYKEYSWILQNGIYRKPTINDIISHYAKYYIRVPDWCAYRGDEGCYSYCNKGERGSFPIWVIRLEDLKKENKNEFE